MRAIYELLNHHIILGLISQNFLAKKKKPPDGYDHKNMQQKRIITHNNYVESFSQMKVFFL